MGNRSLLLSFLGIRRTRQTAWTLSGQSASSKGSHRALPCRRTVLRRNDAEFPQGRPIQPRDLSAAALAVGAHVRLSALWTISTHFFISRLFRLVSINPLSHNGFMDAIRAQRNGKVAEPPHPYVHAGRSETSVAHLCGGYVAAHCSTAPWSVGTNVRSASDRVKFRRPPHVRFGKSVTAHAHRRRESMV
jgi:hypothetical protein